MLGDAAGLRPPAVLLLRPVRRRHGVRGLRPRRGTASSSAAIPASREFIAFWLAGDRVRRGHERQRLGRHRPDPAADPRARRRSTTGASPTPTSRSRSSPRSRKRARHEPPPATARRRRLDLARHALARAAGQRRVRDADRRLRGHRRDLEPDDLRQGDHRLRPLRRPAPRRRRRRRRATRRSSSSRSRSTTSAAPPTCCARPTTRAAGATASSPSSARPTSPTTPRPRSSRRVELWGRLARPNVMIKVPATEAGIPAIEELTARGVNVNVTLLFSVARYEQVIDAYIAGLERRAARGRAASTRSPRSPRSSSRASTPRPTPCSRPARTLRGRVAIANARARLRGAIATASPTSAGCALRDAGARPQRPLWASTGTKDPAYSDVLYVEELIAPGRHQHDARGDPARLRRPRRRHAAPSTRAPAPPSRRSAAPRTQASTSPPSPRSSSAKACARSAPPTSELLDCIETKLQRAGPVGSPRS